MHYFLFADKDTTIYQASSSLNAGNRALSIHGSYYAAGN